MEETNYLNLFFNEMNINKELEKQGKELLNFIEKLLEEIFDDEFLESIENKETKE